MASVVGVLEDLRLFDSPDERQLRKALQLKAAELEELQAQVAGLKADVEALDATRGEDKNTVQRTEAAIKMAYQESRANQVGNANELEGKYNEVHEQVVVATSALDGLKERQPRLQHELDELQKADKRNSDFIERNKKMDGNQIAPPPMPRPKFRTAHPPSFFQHVGGMKEGDVMSVFVKDQFKACQLMLTPDATTLKIATTKGKALYSIQISAIQGVQFPATIASKKARKLNAKPHMMFSIATAEDTVVVMVAKHAQLPTWFLGLHNLALKPGQGPMKAGELLWARARAKVAFEAAGKGVSASVMVAEAFNSMLPEEDDEENLPMDDGEGEDDE